MSTTTMYAIKKVDKEKANHNITAIMIKKQSPPANQGGDSSVWQRKGSHPPHKVGSVKAATFRKRNKRQRRRKHSSSAQSTQPGGPNDVHHENDDAASTKSTTPSRTTSPRNSTPSKKGSKQRDGTPSYDPATNPYSLENYKRDPELQITLETAGGPSNGAKTHLPAATDTAEAQSAGAAGSATTAAAGSIVPIISIQQQSAAQQPGAATTNGPSTTSPLAQLPMTPLFPSPKQQLVGAPQAMPIQLPPSFPPATRPNTVQRVPQPVQRLHQMQQSVHQRRSPQPQHNGQGPRHNAHHGGHGVHGHPAHHNGQHPHHHHSNRSMHHIPLRSMSLQDHLALQDASHCPHGNLTPEQLINIKIRKRNVCYVVGLPIHVATEQKLRAQEWFGQFGSIATIAINRNQKSTLANSIPAHITYDNNISALNAINFCNKFVFDDGRKLKATFGTQHYCRWFISVNKKCTNVYCGFRHSWCRADDIITAKDIADFKAIPAGAYTSRNIENQPMGMRSQTETFNHSSHTLQSPHPIPLGPRGIPPPQRRSPPLAAPPLLGAGGQSARTVPMFVGRPTQNTASRAPQHRTQHAVQPQPSLAQQKMVESVSAAPPLPASYSVDAAANGNQSKTPLTAITTDPYTFYLSNSALTPTGPSPLPAAEGSAAAGALPGGSLGVVSPMATSYHSLADRRFKSLVSLNEEQRAEIERLEGQMKVLSEMEMKNKQEIHKWWNEAERAKIAQETATAKVSKLKAEMSALNAKHDELQIKYLELDEKYQALLSGQKAEDSGWRSWGTAEVVSWLQQLDGGKFKKYEAALAANLAKENIDGKCLQQLDKGDLHRFGVTDFKDKTDLLHHVQALSANRD